VGGADWLVPWSAGDGRSGEGSREVLDEGDSGTYYTYSDEVSRHVDTRRMKSLSV